MQIPEKIRECHEALKRDVALLHLRWKLYRDLFAQGPKRVSLLNDAAPAFFAHFQNILRDDVVLRLCRLTDPAESNGYKNLSLSTLIQMVSEVVEHDQKEKIKSLWKDLKQKTKPFDHLRNKMLAHTDFDHAVASSDSEKRSMGFLLADVENALKSVRSIMNSVEDQFTNQKPSDYEYVSGWSYQIIEILKEASYLKQLIDQGQVERLDYLKGEYGEA